MKSIQDIINHYKKEDEPMHKYICYECNEKPFTTWFEPITALNPAFCPCCGSDEKVEYDGKVESEEV
jgi:DNA-directed RNA polymerase subunit RPC12/RpoP